MNTPEKPNKFEEVDLPKILAALHKAREAKCPGRVVVEFASTGGVLAIKRHLEENLK